MSLSLFHHFLTGLPVDPKCDDPEFADIPRPLAPVDVEVQTNTTPGTCSCQVTRKVRIFFIFLFFTSFLKSSINLQFHVMLHFAASNHLNFQQEMYHYRVNKKYFLSILDRNCTSKNLYHLQE